ncbi:hypothetical protein D770_04820 [Flammeovirgaceae bacterium 311]|nr:hypothetical protein D770_04820 [Flammeovirgaceae bacterium 311]
MGNQVDSYHLEKSIWTESDYEQMGWHDSRIYGLSFQNNSDGWTGDLILDIDYIFQWLHPVTPDKYFKFWVAPCTLVFKEVFDLQIDINTASRALELEIADLHLVNQQEHDKKIYFEWHIELQQGNINLKSYGLEQVVRQKPVYSSSQTIPMGQRGGVSFSREPC